MSEKFKPYWIMSVNNYICDASYSGKELKARCKIPSFRKFSFIRNNDELHFNKRSEISNEDLIKKLLTTESDFLS